MENIVRFILERLKITKNTKSIDTFDSNNVSEELFKHIIYAVFISIYDNKWYKIKGLASYVIARTSVDYKKICSVLNDEYGYNFDIDVTGRRNGEFHKYILKNILDKMGNLINMRKNVTFTDKVKNNIELDGIDVYWKIWKNYQIKKYGKAQ